jgi:hypothetical protein
MKKIIKPISKKAHVNHDPEKGKSGNNRSKDELMKVKSKKIPRGNFRGGITWFPEAKQRG